MQKKKISLRSDGKSLSTSLKWKGEYTRLNTKRKKIIGKINSKNRFSSCHISIILYYYNYSILLVIFVNVFFCINLLVKVFRDMYEYLDD